MRTSGLRLGRLGGIEVNADLGVLVIGALLAWSLASGILPESVPGHVGASYWSVAAVGAIAFLASLLGHEMAHSVVARRNGLTVKGITLWMLGGVAMFSGETKGPGAEFRIAAAGPAASLVIGATFWGAAELGSGTLPELWVVMLGWLGVINLFLAAFNLLPGAPLDGGRILGAILWKIRGERAAGLQGAAQVGKVLGVLVIVAGGVELVYGVNFSGIWLILIGMFLYNAARSEAGFYGAQRTLTGLPVSAVMLSPVQVAPSWSTVGQVVNGPFASTTQTLVPVVDATGQVIGVIHLDQVKRVPAERWNSLVAADVMESPPNAAWLEATDAMDTALSALTEAPYAFVLSGRDLVGVLGREQVERAMALGVRSPAAESPVSESPIPTQVQGPTQGYSQPVPPTGPPMQPTWNPPSEPHQPRPPVQTWEPPPGRY
jgi:Zn-dependent protease